MKSIDLTTVNHLLLRKQHLANDYHGDDVYQIVEDIAGLHATGTREPYLSLFARALNFTRDQLDEELYVKRSLGKIRCMRGTLYILTKEKIPIAYAATRAMVEKLSQRYAEFRGVSLRDYPAIARSILDRVAGSTMTLAEIKASLKMTWHVPSILNLMCDQGLLVRIQSGNGWKSKNYQYAAFREYFPDVNLAELSESEGTALLVRQYLSSFGPATEDDITWWTGLTKAKVREALDTITQHLAHVSIQDVDGDFLVLRSDLDVLRNREVEISPTINLLPTLDPYLMGFKQRQRYLRHEDYSKIFDRSGNATSTILLNSNVIGVWDFVEKPEPLMKVHLFRKTTGELVEQIVFKAQQLGQFIAERKVSVKKVQTMVPLSQRTAGAFMSPLRDG